MTEAVQEAGPLEPEIEEMAAALAAPEGTPARLAANLAGKSEAEIASWVEDNGAEAVLGRIMRGIEARFLPERAGDGHIVLEYNVSGLAQPQVFQVIVENGECHCQPGATRTADVTLIAPVSIFLQLMARVLTGQEAFMAGSLKIEGDMVRAQEHQAWFNQAW